MNHNFVKCVKTADKISEIKFETNGKSKISIIIEDRDIVLQINKRNYVLTPCDAPARTVYKMEDKNYNAKVLKESTIAKINEDEAVILDGDNNYIVNGNNIDVCDDVITFEGRTYRAGDTIIIDGKEATVSLVKAN